MDNDKQSFWDHLDVLRAAIIRIVAVTVIFGVLAFFFKEQLFAVVLAPKDSGFITYRLFDVINGMVTDSYVADFSIRLINTGLAEQFIIHMKTAMYAGVLCASPYILYQLFRFVSPALYTNERKYATRVVGSGYLMFIWGVLLSYYMVFPLTFRFLGTYQVSGEVENMITLQSYISTLVIMSLAMGIVFEMPVLSWLFAKLGFLSADFMCRYRKHAVIIILIIAAIITPTSDIFTLLLVSLPMWILYEISIYIAKVRIKSEIPIRAGSYRNTNQPFLKLLLRKYKFIRKFAFH